jgi:hypothetical protein
MLRSEGRRNGTSSKHNYHALELYFSGLSLRIGLDFYPYLLEEIMFLNGIRFSGTDRKIYFKTSVQLHADVVDKGPYSFVYGKCIIESIHTKS